MAEPAHQPTMTIRQLRQARGWTQADLAEQVGVRRKQVQLWEIGKHFPRPATRLALADLFGVSVEAISVGPAEPAPA